MLLGNPAVPDKKARPGSPVRAFRALVWAYSQQRAAKAGRANRRKVRKYAPLSRERSAAHEWETEHGAMFRASGVESPPTGDGFDLIITDDVIRTRKEAESKAFREHLKDSWLDEIESRLEPGGQAILTMTRWHPRDLVGEWLELYPRVVWLRLPALAEEFDESKPVSWENQPDPLGRKPGQALCPKSGYDEAFFLAKKKRNPYGFASLYQQRPSPKSGGVFDVSRIEIVESVPPLVRIVRYWDLGGGDGGDFTVGGCLAEREDGGFIILDVERGDWPSGERERRIKQTSRLDRPETTQVVEQEPGSGGKHQAKDIVKRLAGSDVEKHRRTGDKVTYAKPFAAQVNEGNVSMLRSGRNAEGESWNDEVIDELSNFPLGEHDDIVDALSGAFDIITGDDEVEVS